MHTPRIIREAEAILRSSNPPPWQGGCPHTCDHTTVVARWLGCRLRCCQCDVVLR